MFIKRNRTQHGAKPYQSVLLVQGKRVPAKRAPGRPAAGASPPRTIVVHETLANLSRLPVELVALIEAFCQGSLPDATATPCVGTAAPKVVSAVHVGPCYGLLAGLHALARELGIVRAVGEATRTQRLALYLIYARLAHQGSRLSAARASEDHAVREVLQVGAFDEDDLYAALDYLAAHQRVIETALAPKAARGAVFLYDVTSVYFEGQHNELAAFGYNRDGKRGKQQMVAGVLTDGTGEPLSIQLYAGNTSDPPTFLDAVEQLKVRFGTEEIAVVGDRGMIKALGQAALGAAHFRYVTALTDPQVRALLKTGVLQLGLFEDQPAEVTLGNKRYVLRCNPQTQARERARRADQWSRVRGWIEARNAAVAKQPRCEPESSLRGAQARVAKYRLGGWVSVRLEARQVVWTEDAQARELEAQLDGCYVVESDLPAAVASTQAVHDRYLDLTRVERDFRTLKTGLLEIRPVFLRKADRTRGHAVVSLLALKLARELERRVAPLGLTVDDAVERLKGVRLVCLGDVDLGLWRLADSYPAAQIEVLGVLPKLPSPVLSLAKANKRRLRKTRQDRTSQ
ncbi:MAG: IS1634 family transposase [Gammaproteobacteria bacterium]|nr:IS1634 family transposase [Gammaproteobacteria bacterium]